MKQTITMKRAIYIIRQGYYFLKSFTRMGLGGMNVVRTYSTDKDVLLTAFSPGTTNEAHAFNILNVYENEKRKVFVKISGAEQTEFQAFRTSMEENYVPLGVFKVKNGGFYYEAPEKSSTSFFAIQ